MIIRLLEGILGLANGGLNLASGLVHLAFGFELLAARYLADGFLDAALGFLCGTFDAILVHSFRPSLD